MNNAKELFRQAVNRLEVAHEELNRPDDDVMTLSVCYQSRTILADMMGAYLTLQGKDFSNATDLESMRQLSAESDPRFSTLDLQSMVCHPTKLVGEPCFCMDLGRVRTCLAMTDQCKGWVEEAFASK
jgi:hypothetical protein